MFSTSSASSSGSGSPILAPRPVDTGKRRAQSVDTDLDSVSAFGGELSGIDAADFAKNKQVAQLVARVVDLENSVRGLQIEGALDKGKALEAVFITRMTDGSISSVPAASSSRRQASRQPHDQVKATSKQKLKASESTSLIGESSSQPAHYQSTTEGLRQAGDSFFSPQELKILQEALGGYPSSANANPAQGGSRAIKRSPDLASGTSSAQLTNNQLPIAQNQLTSASANSQNLRAESYRDPVEERLRFLKQKIAICLITTGITFFLALLPTAFERPPIDSPASEFLSLLLLVIGTISYAIAWQTGGKAKEILESHPWLYDMA